MNAQDRKRLNELADQLETIKDALEEMAEAEQDKYDNMPEGLQDTDRANRLYEIAEALSEAANDADSLLDNLNEIVEM